MINKILINKSLIYANIVVVTNKDMEPKTIFINNMMLDGLLKEFHVVCKLRR